MYKIYNDEDILVAESKKELDHSIITLLEGCGYKCNKIFKLNIKDYKKLENILMSWWDSMPTEMQKELKEKIYN